MTNWTSNPSSTVVGPSSPAALPTLPQPGQRVRIPLDQLVNWMLAHGLRCVGGDPDLAHAPASQSVDQVGPQHWSQRAWSPVLYFIPVGGAPAGGDVAQDCILPPAGDVRAQTEA